METIEQPHIKYRWSINDDRKSETSLSDFDPIELERLVESGVSPVDACKACGISWHRVSKAQKMALREKYLDAKRFDDLEPSPQSINYMNRILNGLSLAWGDDKKMPTFYRFDRYWHRV